MYFTIQEVIEIRAMADEGWFYVDFWLIFPGQTEAQWIENYVLGPDDPYGAAPALREWMFDHPDFPIVPYEA